MVSDKPKDEKKDDKDIENEDKKKDDKDIENEDKKKDDKDIEKDDDYKDIIKALGSETRDKIVRFLLKNIVTNSTILQKEFVLAPQTINENLDILSNVNLIQKIRPPHTHENKKDWKEKYGYAIMKKMQDICLGDTNQEVNLFYLDIDKFVEILKKFFKSYVPSGSYFESAILEDYKIMATSRGFMDNVPTNGWMNICFPAYSAELVATHPIYTKGYKKMKERGITIRVITEITIDNYKYLIIMIQEGLVDEIRFLKKVSCGIAVSENQYMAAQSDNEPKNGDVNSYFATAIYHTEKKAIKIYQSVFDTLWENANTLFKK